MSAKENRFAAGCMALFGLPFAAVGIFVIYMMLLAPRTKPVPIEITVVGVIAGAVFATAGFSFIFGAFFAKKKADAFDRLKAAHPGQPWKWRADWTSGVASSRDASSTGGKWFAAILWNGITSIGVILAGVEAARKHDPRVLFFLPFLAVGIWLAMDAVRQTIRRAEFGRGALDLAQVPYCVGGQLRATIHARFNTLPENGVHVRLTCVHRTVSGSGKNRSTKEQIVWRDEADVASMQIVQGPEGSLIPVTFQIPFDQPESNTERYDDAILWILDASAAVPGIDYADAFDVPVYGRVEAPAGSGGDTATAFAPAPVREPRQHTIVVTPIADGTRFYFPADRNPGAAFGITVFALLFGAVVAFLIKVRAPLLFPLVFGFFDAILVLIALYGWMGTSNVVIGADKLTLHSGLLGVGRIRTIAFSDIASIDSAIGMQSGGAQGTPYYDLRLRTTSGRTYTLGSSVRDKHEAEWLLAQMRKAVGANNAPR